MSAPTPIPIAEREPVFPCWLWHRGNHLMQAGWHHSETMIKSLLPAPDHTHWLPDSPAAPNTTFGKGITTGSSRPAPKTGIDHDADSGLPDAENPGRKTEPSAQSAAPDVAALARELVAKMRNESILRDSNEADNRAIAILTPTLATLAAERDAAVRATTDAALDVIAVSQELAEQINENGALTAALSTAREREGKLREAVEQVFEELDGRYDGAPDSKTHWMASHLERLRALLTPPDAGTEEKR